MFRFILIVCLAVFLSTAPVFAQPVIKVGKVLGAPGDTVRVPVVLENPEDDIGGAQFNIMLVSLFSGELLEIDNLAVFSGFNIISELENDIATFLIFSSEAAVIASGTYQIAELVYVIGENASLGEQNTLIIIPQDELTDRFGSPIEHTNQDGALYVGISGDVNLSGKVTVSDIVKLVRMILNLDTPPAQSTALHAIANVNGDVAIDIADVIAQVNIILDDPFKRLVNSPTQPAQLSLGNVVEINGQLVVPIIYNANGTIAGAQMSLDLSDLSGVVGELYLNPEISGMSLASNMSGGKLEFIVFPNSPANNLPEGKSILAYLPVQHGALGVITLSEAKLADAQAQMVQVEMSQSSLNLSHRFGGVPNQFSLAANAPNPFNPATTIAYEVPQRSHITLTVYNLLGQEVARLVDSVQSAGRFEVVWNARNQHGRAVGSGVYLYRLESDTGYVSTRRMTLLK